MLASPCGNQERMILAVPDYQTLMWPSLNALADGLPRGGQEVREFVAKSLGISDEDRAETIKSGSSVFDSRVQWAITYLSQAGLIDRPKRGIVQITDRGHVVSPRPPGTRRQPRIDAVRGVPRLPDAQPPARHRSSIARDVTRAGGQRPRRFSGDE
jgi:restriction system protein